MAKKLPIVAIIGRANVGKSSIFNSVLKRRENIVAIEPGTTRDSVMLRAEYKQKYFWLVDTAGVKDPDDDFEFTIQEQIIQAADSADIIWVVVEADVPITEEDRKVAKLALKSQRPVILVVNKVDKAKNQNLELFRRLGIKDIFYTSATQNRGIDTLLNKLVKDIPKISKSLTKVDLTIAIIGRPNVGKSQLFNTLAKKQQALVSDRAGTTRDINRTAVKYKNKSVELLDTAGIRRSGKIKPGVERFSVIRALSAIEQSDVCLVLMDVHELNVQLDQKIAGMVKEAGKGLILVVSKWDDVEEKDSFTRDVLAKTIASNFAFVPWAPLIFTSSVTGQNVTKLYDLALEINKTMKKTLLTSTLNKWLKQSVIAHPPAGLKNRNPKLNYIVQETDNTLPAFKIYGSSTKYLHWSYRRYLETRLRRTFGFEGSPVQLWFIDKHQLNKRRLNPEKEKVI